MEKKYDPAVNVTTKFKNTEVHVDGNIFFDYFWNTPKYTLNRCYFAVHCFFVFETWKKDVKTGAAPKPKKPVPKDKSGSKRRAVPGLLAGQQDTLRSDDLHMRPRKEQQQRSSRQLVSSDEDDFEEDDVGAVVWGSSDVQNMQQFLKFVKEFNVGNITA